MQLDLFKKEEESNGCDLVTCRSCGKMYPHTREFFHLRSTTSREGRGTKDYLFYECKDCRNKLGKVRNILRQKHIHLRMDCCDCCGKKTDALCLDHDHETELFRGWLCNECNTGMGLLGDSEEGLERALHYLRKTNGQP